MKNAKRFCSAVLAAVLLSASVLTGCSNSGTSSGAAASGQADGAIKANIRVLYPGTTDVEKNWATEVTKKLHKTQPGINVEYIFLSWTDLEKKMTIMVQSHDYPDLMQIQDITNPVAMNALEPLDSYLGGKVKKDQFVPAALDNMVSGGKLYAIPLLMIPYAHVVNTDLLTKAGMKPDDLKSWDDVVNAAKKITATGANGYAMANGGDGRFTFRDFEMIALSDGFTPDDTSDQTKAKYLETLKLISQMSSSMPKSQSTWQYPELFKAWEAGTTGIMHTGSYFTANVIANGTKSMDRTQVVPFPKGPSGSKQTIMVGAVGYSIMAGSKNKEAAWKFIESAMDADVLAKLAGSINAPAVTYIPDDALLQNAKAAYGDDVGAKHIKLVKEFQKAAQEYGVRQPSILGQSAMAKVLQSAIVNMTNGELTPEQAYDQIKSGIEHVKEQMK